jgi:para-aminobenzoate synthetase component 1
LKHQLDISFDEAHLFESAAQYASSFGCYAFYITDLNHFSCAIGAKRVLSLGAEPESGGASFDKVAAFAAQSSSRIAGYFGYDLKNELEVLTSDNPDAVDMPDAFFFEPEIWIEANNGKVCFRSNDIDLVEKAREALTEEVVLEPKADQPIVLRPLTDRNRYIESVESLQRHLHRGDIYEANYCMQYVGKAADFDPLQKFLTLQQLTEAPYSVFAKLGEHYVLCASPERFLKNEGGKLTSQPIKGTIKRSADLIIDAHLSDKLRNDPKEQSENVMIVDLVRNDLSRVAARGSVKVDELFGMYPFKTVHHMISTVTAQLDPNHSYMDAIKACFPMGSMTGAPKISAMKCIEAHEDFRRGAYSGGFGWIDPNGNFDFNVMIRTLFYNKSTSVLSFAVGSAITIKALPENEYEECLLKAKALMQALDISTTENENAPSIW